MHVRTCSERVKEEIMAEKIITKFQEIYSALEKMGKKREAALVWGFSLLLVFGDDLSD